MFIKERITQGRKKKKFSPQRLALEIFKQRGRIISGQTISNFEAGITIPRADDLVDIAFVLGVSIMYFFTQKHTQSGLGINGNARQKAVC